MMYKSSKMYKFSDTYKHQQELDEYITPRGLAKAMVKLLNGYGTEQRVTIVDPCANIGRFNQHILDGFPHADLINIELMEMPDKPTNCIYWDQQDFLAWGYTGTIHAFIGNPPYSNPEDNIAENFVRHALTLLPTGGQILYLMRDSFDAAKCRLDLCLSGIHLFKKYKCIPRPSFDKEDKRTERFGKSNTNSQAYSVYHFIKNYIGHFTTHPLIWSYEDGEGYPDRLSQ